MNLHCMIKDMTSDCGLKLFLVYVKDPFVYEKLFQKIEGANMI